MTDKTAARLALLRKAVLDELRAVDLEARADLAAEMRPGDAVAAYIGEEVPLGRVRMDKPRTSARVVDQEALLAWCKRYAPEQVMTLEAIRPAFVDALTKGKGILPERVDEATGEICPEMVADGIEVSTAARGILNVTVSDEAKMLARVIVAGLPEALESRLVPEVES